MATATIRPGAVSWRSGFDDYRHAVASVRPARAACGARIRAERFDRPDHQRCISCLTLVGIDVTARVAPPTSAAR